MTTSPCSPDALQLALDYLQAVAAGARGEALARFFHADAIQEEFPNRLVPNGVRRDLAAVLAAAERGAASMREQRWDVLSSLVDGDRVVLEVAWSATVAVPLGPLPAGHVMRARFAVFVDVRDGRISSTRNYDCFEPW